MLREKLSPKATFAVVGAVLAFAVVGFVGYKSLEKKQEASLASKRAWLVNRESGMPLSMEPGSEATAEEREDARIAAKEKMQWGGQSEVDTTAVSGVAP